MILPRASTHLNPALYTPSSVFTRARLGYASAVALYLSVCLSVTSQFCIEIEHVCFYFLVFFSVLHFLVFVSVRLIKLTRVGFRAHVKIASRIVSYCIEIVERNETVFG